MESIKSCIDCGVFLTDKTGYRRKGGGYLSRCKSCHGFYVKDRYDNPRRGGLSALEYDTLLDDSRGNCHCCGTRGSRNALRFRGSHHIYCDTCAGVIRGGPSVLSLISDYMGVSVDSPNDIW